MPRFNLNYTFSSDGSCGDCPFWEYGGTDGWCPIVNMLECEKDDSNFDRDKGRFRDCPIRPLDEGYEGYGQDELKPCPFCGGRAVLTVRNNGAATRSRASEPPWTARP